MIKGLEGKVGSLAEGRSLDPADAAMLKKWYFSINERGFSNCLDQMKVAIRSCLKNTRLIPHCIYAGGNVDHVKILEDMGVNVVPHRISIEDELRKAYREKYDIFCGHWLRVDLPIIELQENFVLYTDTDVVFLKDIPEIDAPEFLAAAPEFKIDDYSKFNSGVMLMNVNTLRSIHDEFIGGIKERLAGDFKYPAHDQESYNRFFRDRYTRLPALYNWKAYWGFNPDAIILHLHGPKFHVARRLCMGDDSGVPPGHVRLWKKNPDAYQLYEQIYMRYL